MFQLTPLHFNRAILLFRFVGAFSRQQYSAINSNRQPSMPASKHDSAENEFAECMPRAGERICVPWNARGDTNAAVRGDDFENDIERRKDDWVSLKLPSLGDRDKEDCQTDPPKIVCELATQLLSDEVAP